MEGRLAKLFFLEMRRSPQSAQLGIPVISLLILVFEHNALDPFDVHVAPWIDLHILGVSLLVVQLVRWFVGSPGRSLTLPTLLCTHTP